MVCAIIDVGSNSIRLCAYKIEGTHVARLFNEKEMAGLAGYVHHNKMSPKGIQRAADVLNGFKHILEGLEIRDVRVFATASLRNIANTDEALSVIKQQTGLDIHVITGEEEGVLDYIGATHLFGLTDGLLVDIGGGSTELVAFGNNSLIKSVSIPIGSLNLHTKHVAGILPSKGERRAIRQAVKDALGQVDMPSDTFGRIVGVGGTIRAARRIYNNEFHNTDTPNELNAYELRALSSELYDGGRDALDIVLRLTPERVHTLIPGLIVINTIAKRYSASQILVSDYGVREGYLYKYIMGM